MTWKAVSKKPAGLSEGPVTIAATIIFITIPPSVLPAATTLNTVPKECLGTMSTTNELIFINQANAAITVKTVNVSDAFKPVADAIKGDKGINKAQTNMTHIRLATGITPFLTILPDIMPPNKLPTPAAK